jgi:DNA polymerase
MKVTKGEDNFINIPRLGQVYMSTPEALSIKLPSGRYLYYIKPQIGLNKFGGESFTYMGLNLGKWTRLESFGGKIVENCIQSIARDCLCTIIHRVSKRLNLYPVTHIHDEVVLEAPEAEAEETLQKVLAIMAEPISWAPGLTLKGAGYIGSFYFKD